MMLDDLVYEVEMNQTQHRDVSIVGYRLGWDGTGRMDAYDFRMEH